MNTSPPLLTRRAALAGALALAAAPATPRPARAQEAILGDDGIYRQPWFLESFLELAEDLEEAQAEGKRFALMFELRGCPFCRDIHLVNFAVPEVSAFVRERFAILSLNLIGDRELTDFDGTRAPEKEIAARYGVRFTPTILFFPERAEGLGGLPPRQREVLRVVGYQEPEPFRRTFAFVAERAYERTTLPDYLREG